MQHAPTIAYVNYAKTPLGIDLDKLVAASQKFVDTIFAPVWGAPAHLVHAATAPAGAWLMGFYDTADQAGALGYHDLAKDGLPVSKIFVKDTLKNGGKVSVTACHELCEMLIDPAVQLWAQNTSTGQFYAYEMCDAVEDGEFAVDGVVMSNFVYPEFFEGFRKPNSVKLDHLAQVSRPFQTLRGGYQIVMRGGKINEVFGSEEKRRVFAQEDRRMHRSEFRKANALSLSALLWERLT